MSDRCKVPTIVYVVNIFVASGMCLLLLTVASYGQLSKLIEEQSVEKKLAIRIVATTSVLACIGPVTSILVSVCGLPMSCCKATPCIKNTQTVLLALAFFVLMTSGITTSFSTPLESAFKVATTIDTTKLAHPVPALGWYVIGMYALAVLVVILASAVNRGRPQLKNTDRI